MKKKKVEEIESPIPIEQVLTPARFVVQFTQPFEGCLNNYTIKVQSGEVKELPEHIYQWLQKFKVCKDA